MEKLKVALCMRGAVGKNIGPFSNKNVLYNKGEYEDYHACFNSIQKHIIETNKEQYNIDIFCQGWNKDLEEDIINKYKPIKYIFEDNSMYNDLISKLCEKESDFGGISQALAFKKVIELKEEYEKEINIEYDIVILYRYDVILWKNIYLNEYTDLNDYIYVNAHNDCNGDFHFIMNNEKSKSFKNLINSIELGNKHICHYWIKNYIINYMKSKIKVDNIIPGKHQEVIRKIWEFSISTKHLSMELFNSYKK